MSNILVIKNFVVIVLLFSGFQNLMLPLNKGIHLIHL
jgi:hypothetical protein